MSRSSTRVCRGCGVVIQTDAASLAEHMAVAGVGGRTVRAGVRAGVGLRYCAPCRARYCTTCQRRGGQHRADCPVGAGRGRAELPYRGVVSEEDFLAVCAGARARAVRLAARLCGPRDAEDVVQATVAYLWRRRETLAGFSIPFFLYAVKRKAHVLRHTAYHRALHLTERDWRTA